MNVAIGQNSIQKLSQVTTERTNHWPNCREVAEMQDASTATRVWKEKKYQPEDTEEHFEKSRAGSSILEGKGVV